MAKVTEQDFLDVCHHTEWKSTVKIRQELEAAKDGASVSYGIVHSLAERLEEKGFIESRETPDTEGTRGGRPRKEVRLTQDGTRERHRLHQEDEGDSTERD